MSATSEQELFWQGDFGSDYAQRNAGAELLAANAALFARALARMQGVSSVLEFGANIGLNLMALRSLLPGARLSAVEINAAAAGKLAGNVPGVEIHNTSMLDFEADGAWDLVLTKGLLIHLDPKQLPAAYDLLHRASSRYVLVCEYYDPRPVEVPYRGHAGKLFKRDFAGELLERHADLCLRDYGFVYRRDPTFPLDDITWFLLERSAR